MIQFYSLRIKGKYTEQKDYEIPEYGRTAKGLPIINLLGVEKDEKVTAMIPMRSLKKIIISSLQQTWSCKRTPVSGICKYPCKWVDCHFTYVKKMNLIAVRLTDGNKQIIIGTRQGKLIRFEETDIRSMGRTAGGVRGIRLKEDDYVVGMEIIEDDQEDPSRYRKRIWKTYSRIRISYTKSWWYGCKNMSYY